MSGAPSPIARSRSDAGPATVRTSPTLPPSRRSAKATRVLGAVVACLLVLAHAGGGQRLQIRNYSSDDGLAQSAVYAILQDRLGYLWFGTYAGVSRYDGVAFTAPPGTEGLKGQVRCLFETASGAIVLCSTTGAYSYERERLRPLPLADPAASTVVSGLEDRKGRLWFGTMGSGVLVLQEDRPVTLQGLEALEDLVIWRLLEGADGSIWVGTRGRGLARWKEGDLEWVVPREGPRPERIFSLAEGPDGTVYAGTGGNGMLVIEEGRPRRLGPVDGLASENVSAVLPLGRGRLWVGTFGSGIQLYGTEDPFVIRERNGLASDFVTSALVDYEGTLWVGTYGSGVSKYLGRRFENYTRDEGLAAGFVTSVSQGADGTLYFGTRGGGISEFDGRDFSPFPRAGSLSSDLIRCLFHDRNDRLWVGSNGGLDVVSGEGVRHLGVEEGLMGEYVNSVRESPDGSLWVLTNDPFSLGVFRFDGNAFSPFEVDATLPHGRARAIDWSADGSLWLSGSSYLVRRSKDETVVYQSSGRFPEVEVRSMVVTPEGVAWIASSEGVVRFEDGDFSRLTAAEGLPSDDVYSAILGPDGEVWFGTDRGIARLGDSGSTTFDRSDGLVADESSWSSLLFDDDGNLWIGTSGGVSKYSPAAARPNPVEPRILIESVEVGGRSVSIDEPLTLDHRDGALRFRFAALSFRQEESVRYRHRLLGLEEEWECCARESQVTYEWIPPGEYVFEVEARNAAGVWSSAPARVELAVTPPPWQRPWALGAMAALVFGGLGFAVQRASAFAALRQKRADLARFEKRHRDLFEDAPDLYLSLSTDGTIRHCNRATTWMLGFPKEELMGRSFFELIREEERERVRSSFRGLFEEGRPIQLLEAQVCARDGTSRWVSINSGILHDDEEGSSPLTVTIVRDTTEQKRAEVGMRRAQRLESIGLLAGGIAHDFNNILTAIMGNAELARAGNADRESRDRHLENIMVSSRRAADLTRQMLAFAGEGSTVRVGVDLNLLVAEIAQLLEVSLPKGVRLEVEPSRESPIVLADKGQVFQIIMNLVTNAAEAVSPSTGVVRLTLDVTGSLPGGESLFFSAVESPRPGKLAVIAVRDNGVGMSPEETGRVFEPFYSTKFAGRGLGLAAVLGIVRVHRGAIGLESEPGKGTCFRIYFPSEGEVEDRESSEPCEEPAGRGRVLVVDDEAGVRQILRSALESAGFNVVVAENGREAVDLVHESGAELDLVVLDVTMPVMNGDRALRLIREVQPDLPVLLSSGYSEGVAHAELHEMPRTGFLQKPYLPADLLRLVSKMLERESR